MRGYRRSPPVDRAVIPWRAVEAAGTGARELRLEQGLARRKRRCLVPGWVRRKRRYLEPERLPPKERAPGRLPPKERAWILGRTRRSAVRPAPARSVLARSVLVGRRLQVEVRLAPRGRPRSRRLLRRIDGVAGRPGEGRRRGGAAVRWSAGAPAGPPPPPARRRSRSPRRRRSSSTGRSGGGARGGPASSRARRAAGRCGPRRRRTSRSPGGGG